VPDAPCNRGRSGRALIAGIAVAALLASGQVLTGNALADQTITVAPDTPNSNNVFPFGTSAIWPPYLGFVYKNVPAFQVRPNDVLAFDLSTTNNADDQLDIALASTTTNGGDVPAAPFTQIVSNTQLPAAPRGNDVNGDYELAYTAQAPFNFPGGGLIIRFSNPGPQLAADMDGSNGVFKNGGDNTDTSGYFVERFVHDMDGTYPWTGDTYTYDIAAFRLRIADQPPSAPSTTTTTKRCKKKHKKHSASAAKKCKKKRR
jgi:hypothetical protein